MVGRLVEQEHIGLLEKKTTESHTTALTTGEIGDWPVAGRTTKRTHCTVELGIHIPCVGGINDILHLSLALHQFVHLVGIAIVFLKTEFLIDFLIFGKGFIDLLHSFLHILLDCLCLVEGRILRQIANGISRTPYHLALCGLLNTGNDFHQCRFSGTIKTYDTDFRTIEEREVNVLQYLFLILGNNLGHSHHREDYLLVIYCCHFCCISLLSGNYFSAKIVIISDMAKCFSIFWSILASSSINTA